MSGKRRQARPYAAGPVAARSNPTPAWPRPAAWVRPSAPYLAHLLRAALTAPGAEGEVSAPAFVADLLVTLAEAGGGAEAAWALSPQPGGIAVYEVRSFSSGSLDPFEPFGTDDPGVAILTTRDRAREANRSVELVSRDATGLQRSVLTQRGTGDLAYRFPELACLEAPDAGGGQLAAVVERWRLALFEETPSAFVTPPVAPGATPVEVDADAVAAAVLDLLVEDGRALRTYDVADVLATLIPTAADVADLVVERLVAHFESQSPPDDD